MWLLFVFWATQATWKYIHEEESTTSFNVRNNDMTYELPKVTLCPLSELHSIYQNKYGIEPSILQNLINEDFFYYFHERLEKNLEHFYEINSSIFYDIHNVVVDGGVYINHEKLQSKESNWSPAYHSKYGLCYTLEVKQNLTMNIQKFEPITISIEFDIESQAMPTKAGIALLHDSDDLSFAAQHSSSLPFNTWQTNFVGFNSIYTVRKTKITSESTPNTPCAKEFPNVCWNNIVNKWSRTIHNCTLLFLNSLKNEKK